MSECRTPAAMVDGMVTMAGVAGGAEDPAHFRWHAERMVTRIFAAAQSEGIIVRRAWCMEHGRGACYVFTNNPERPDGTDWFAAFLAQLREDDDEEGCPWGRG
jgi:hypothetical protein